MLSDQVWRRNINRLFQKLHLQIYASQFMASWIIPLLFGLLSLESVERKKKNSKKLNILTTKRAVLDEIKNIFNSFGKAIIWWKYKCLIKNNGHKL